MGVEFARSGDAQCPGDARLSSTCSCVCFVMLEVKPYSNGGSTISTRWVFSHTANFIHGLEFFSGEDSTVPRLYEGDS